MQEWRVISGEQRDTLGEGPLWSARRNALLWVDIFEQAIYQLDCDAEPSSDAITRWALPERVGFIAEESGSDALIVGLKTGIARVTLDPLRVERITTPEADRPQNRLNDGKVDAQGRLWFGSKNDDEDVPTGALYRLDSGLTLTREDDHYICTNGPAFSLDGRTMWHNDSTPGIVYAYGIDAEGHACNRREFLRFPAEWGLPDGMTVDAEDHLWIAHWGGSRISRFTPEGKLVRAIALPASQITSVTFGGENFDRLFVTSARWQREDEPLAGALFEVDACVRGVAPMKFGRDSE